ncbi:glycosyl hydrolase family 28-related protein [Cohnella terricola]|uniref:Rhamnogalacturonase A/B/Epimerase-like pectate lyase domain-containing protein n=1 Tax=Cohnella terricola TaxID=1289167 RepID=A0A559JMK9_9BACL|nr:glycosyl hydrolase family 28-related protein [Cohnella terricola]TVY01113.1 hypothetical protein FPZ45_08125 [Cohnella terricola]
MTSTNPSAGSGGGDSSAGFNGTSIPSAKCCNNVTDYGAKGDGTTDDTAAIQSALNALVKAGKGDALTFPPGTYKITSTITINASYVSILSHGATLDASSMTSGAAINITGTVFLPYKQSTTILEGFKLVGNSQNGNVTGIRFHTPNGNGEGSSHITLRNLNISNFGIGLDYGNHAYLINHYGLDVYSCGICVNHNADAIDGGERINFNGCVFFNSTQAIRIKGDASSFIFQACSFDYNAKQFDIYQSRIFMTNCHIEGNDYAEPPIKLDSDAYLDINGSWILITDGLPHHVPYMINFLSGNSSCRIANSFVNNTKTATDYWATGPGQLILDNIHSYEITQNPLLLSQSQNLLADGGFESTTIKDNIFITEDTAKITNRFTGNNIALSISTSVKRSGSGSLKANKVYGPYSGCAFVIAVPISRPQAMMNASIWFNKPGTGGSGNIAIETGWAILSLNESAVPIIAYEKIRGSVPYNLKSSPSGWINYRDGEPFRRSPTWATHYFVRCYMTVWDSGGNQAIYFDDVEINTIG